MTEIPKSVTSLAMTQQGFAPTTMEEAYRFGNALSKSMLVPTEYQGNAANCIIALDLASRMGVHWLAVMQHVYVVHGRPAMDGQLCITLMNKFGGFVDPVEYEIQGSDNPLDRAYKVRAFATRKANGKKLIGTWVTWDLVRGEKWDAKSGSKWLTMPEQMFKYRAATFFQKVYCPEVTMGMITTEEAAEIVEPLTKHVDSQEVEAPKTGTAALKDKLKDKKKSTPKTKTPTKDQTKAQKQKAALLADEAKKKTETPPPAEKGDWLCEACKYSFTEPSQYSENGKAWVGCPSCKSDDIGNLAAFGGVVPDNKDTNTPAEVEAEKTAKEKFGDEEELAKTVEETSINFVCENCGLDFVTDAGDAPNMRDGKYQCPSSGCLRFSVVKK